MKRPFQNEARRLARLARKTARGLLFSGVTYPDPPTDFVVARTALYDFIAAFSLRAHVVDVTAESGFGSFHLLQTAHPAAIVATDPRAAVVRFAARRYADSRLSFVEAAAAQAIARAERESVIIVSNPSSLDANDVVTRARQKLGERGRLFLASPPLAGPRSSHTNAHEAARAWVELLRREFTVVNIYAAYVPAGGALDLASATPSQWSPRDFRFRQVDDSTLADEAPLSLIYLATDDERFAAPRLHIGCGPQVLDGWLNVDNQPYEGIDFLWDASRGLPFLNATHVFAEHFIEHLRYDDGVGFLRECRRVMSDEGRVRLSTPNLDWVFRACYRAGHWKDEAEEVYDCMAANRAFRGWGHHYLYNLGSLRMLLQEAGFAHVEALGYGESNDPLLRGIERHERYPDVPGLPHVLVVEASGRMSGGSPHSSFMDEYRRDIAVV